MINDTQETVTNHDSSEKTFEIFSSEPKWIKKIHKFAEEYPNEVKITYINADGSLNAKLPIKWFKVSPTKKVSEKQKEAASKRFRQMWADKKDSNT